MRTLPRVVAVALFLVAAILVYADIGIGDTREAVLRQTGNPTSRAKRGDREIFLYAHGGRVEFVDGKVVDARGPLPNMATSTTTPAAQSTTPAGAAVAVPPPASAAKAPANAPAAGPKAPAKTGAGNTDDDAAMAEANPAAAADALGKHIEKMDTAWGTRPPMPQLTQPFNWARFVVKLALHFGVTLLALRIAFKIEEMDAMWSGVLAIAGIDLAVYAVLEALDRVSGGITTMGGVQGGVGALVMVGTIQKFCFNKRMQNAVITAMSVKFVVQLCHIFLFVLLLNALFG